MNIHSTAIVSSEAKIHPSVKIGAYCVIGPNVEIGENTVLAERVSIVKNTSLGKNNKLSPGVVLGDDPQDFKFGGEETFLKIGDNNQMREFVTMHRSNSPAEDTIVGSKFFIYGWSSYRT